MRNRLISGILVFVLFAFTGKVSAGIETDVDFYPANTVLGFTTPVLRGFVHNEGRFSTSGYSGFEYQAVKNMVEVSIDHTYTTYIASNFSYTFKLQVESWDKNNVAQTTQTVELVVEYYPNANPGVSYKDKSEYLFTNGNKVRVTIIGIKDNLAGGGTFIIPASVPANIVITSSIEVEVYDDFNTATTTCPSHTAIDINSDMVDDELDITWTPITGAEEYQLEWTWVDDYTSALGTPASIGTVKYNFRNNSTRVTISGTHYKINLIFERGYVVYRVRGIGRNPNDLTVEMFGAWSKPESATNPSASPCTGSYYYVDHHEENLNWQYSSVYAEEGKKKEVISYYDGSLRNRQSVTKVNTDNTTIVGESIYDFTGRKAIDILPVPLSSQPFQYFANLNLNNETTPEKYSWKDFDLDHPSVACSTLTSAMSDNSGTSNYYSNANANQTNENAYIPDAHLFPFSQVEYTPDNTGRIQRQGGVGPDHQMGTDHETKYYYSKPQQVELDRLFGSEVGHAIFYKKNMVIDPNGQISISYLDMKGKVVATALSGEVPDNVSALESYATAEAAVDADLFEKDANGVSKVNVPNLEFTGVEFNTFFTATNPGEYVFTYGVSPVTLDNVECMNEAICFDCIYDLRIVVRDACGAVVHDLTCNIGSPQVADLDNECNSETVIFPSSENLDPFTLNFDIGTYQITKTLMINHKAYLYYLSEYLKKENSTECGKDLEDFVTEEQAKLNYDDCDLDCDECVAKLGSKDDYVLNEKGTEADWQKEYANCTAPCQDVTTCEVTYNMLLADMAPGGQYAEFLDKTNNTTKVDLFPLSILNSYNELPDENRSISDAEAAYWRNPSMVVGSSLVHEYREEDGVTRSKIEMILKNDGTYYPPSDDPFTSNGITYTYPEDLTNVADFIVNFKPSWARSLVYYHPEYCYYNFCIENLTNKFTAYGKSSDEFDHELKDISSYGDANTAGFITNPMPMGGLNINAIVDLDPYFNEPASAGYGAPKTAMQAALANFQSSGKNMMQMASIMVKVGNFYGTNYTSARLDYQDFTSGPNPGELDDMWARYRAMYLSYKQQLQKLAADNYANSPASCNRGINSCIGEKAFNPLASVMGGSGFITTSYYQPCQIQTYELYINKQRRFDIGAESVEMDEEKADFNAFYKTGMCPIERDFMRLFDEIALAGSFGNNYELYKCKAFTPLMNETINTQYSISSSFGNWLYAPTVINGNTMVVAFRDVTSTYTNTCTFTFTNAVSGGITWSSVVGIKDYNYIEFTTPNHTFEVTALVGTLASYTEVEMTVTTCFNFNSCTFKDQCVNTDFANNLFTLMGVLGTAGQLHSASNINLETGYPSYLTRFIRNEVAAPNNQLTWKYPSAGNFQLFNNSIGGDFINIAFTAYSPNTFTNASIQYIKYFTDLKVGANLTDFTVTAWYLPGGVGSLTSVQVTGNISSGPKVANCYAPVPMECDNIQMQATRDFETLLKDIITDHPTADVNLNENNNYTAVLESFIGKGTTVMLREPEYDDHEITIKIEVMDGSTVTSNCDIKLFRKDPFMMDPDGEFYKISDIGLVFPDYKKMQNGFTNYFTAIVRYDGTPNDYKDAINGYVSCIPIVNCEKCDVIKSGTGDSEDEEEEVEACPMYSVYKKIMEDYNSTHTPDVTIIDRDEIDCSCIDNYLTYIRLNQFPMGNVILPSGPLDITTFSGSPNNCDFGVVDCGSHGGHPTSMGVTAAVNAFNAMYGGLSSPAWFTGNLPAVTSSNCNCKAKYALYLERWTDANNILDPGSIHPDWMPMDFATFEANGCKADDCWDEYLYYASIMTAQSRTIQDYDANMDCNEWIFYADNAPSAWDPPGGAGVGSNATPGTQFISSSGGLYDGIDMTPSLIIPTRQLFYSSVQNVEREPSACPPAEANETVDYEDPCSDYLDQLAIQNAKIRYEQYVIDKTKEFHNYYYSECMKAIETFSMEYNSLDYHFTLYYYDQAGNLVRTVPPAGVKLVSGSDNFEKINFDRTFGTKKFFTRHVLSTVYEYNSLNQLVKQSVPDHDKMDRWYVSDNAGVPGGFEATDIHFVNSNIGYMIGKVGTEKYAYILKTKDGGTTWSRLSDIRTADLQSVSMADDNVGYAVGDDGLLLRTLDGGTNWHFLNPTSDPLADDITGIYAIYSSGPNYEGVLVGKSGFSKYFTDNTSSPSGFSLTDKSLPGGVSGDFTSVTYSNMSPETWFAVINDAGNTKLLSSTTLSGAWVDVAIETKLRAAELTFTQMLSTFDGYACGKDGTLLWTQDGGNSWKYRATGENLHFLQVHFIDVTYGIALASDGKIYKTFDEGHTWAQASIIGTYKDIFLNGNSGYGVGDDGLIARISISSSAITVSKLTLPQTFTDDFTSVAFLSGNNDGIILGTSGIAYRVINGTGNFYMDDISPAAVGSSRTFSKSLIISSTLAAATTTDGKLWKLTLSGSGTSYSSTATDLTTGGNSYADICMQAPNLYAMNTTASPANVHVFNTSSLTTTFSTLSPSPQAGDGTINHIACIDPQTVMLGGANGTRYVHNGIAWSYYSENTTPVDMNAVQAVAGSNTIYVVGEDGSVMRSDNTGGVFHTIETGLATNLFEAAFSDQNTGWAGGSNAKLLKITSGAGAAVYTMSGNITGIVSSTASDAFVITDAASALVHKTADGGTNWSNVVTKPLVGKSVNWNALAATPSGDMVLVGLQGAFVRFESGTPAWSVAYMTPFGMNDIHFNPTGLGMVVGEYGSTMYSDNYGEYWTLNPRVDHGTSTYDHFNKVWVAAADEVYVVGDNAYATTMELNTSSETALTFGTSPAGASLMGLDFNEYDYGIIAGGDKVYRKSPGSGTWTALANPISGAVFTDAEIDGEYAFVVGDNNAILRYTDIMTGSIIDDDLSSGVPGSAGTVNFKKVYMYDQKRVYAVGHNGTDGIIIKTVKGGASWIHKADPATTETIAALGFNKRDGLVVGGTNGFSKKITDQADITSTMFWYDRLGRMVVSQNTRQFNKATKAYSYTLYDEIGRITEVGEKANSDAVETTHDGVQMDDALLQAWITSGANSTRTEITQTYYDVQFSGVSTGVITQTNMRKRVATVSYEDVFDNDETTYEHATHYSYDVHGNVGHLVQDIPALTGVSQQYKHLYYHYDLIDGKVSEVQYSPGTADAMYHKYEYDSDNRITHVSTSHNGRVWDNDARYKYYLHGPLARTELGDLNVQGLDYSYTLQGWIKGVNSNTMNTNRDPGRDGKSGHAHQFTGQDAFGYTLGYYYGGAYRDYEDIAGLSQANKFEAAFLDAGTSSHASDLMENRVDLWNGNISSMVTCLPNVTSYNSSKTISADALGNAYNYDQLNRLASSRSFSNLDYSNNDWNYNNTVPTNYATDYTYDAMGNILSQKRNDYASSGPAPTIDDLDYNYNVDLNGDLSSNRLYSVDDAVSSGVSADDLDDQGTFDNNPTLPATVNTVNNYGYDELGNLIRDDQEEIENIAWTVYGKIKAVTRTISSSKPDMEFGYDASGNRLWKKVKPKPLSGATEKIYYYLRDAQGNEMGHYKDFTDPTNGRTYQLEEQSVYGSSRLGVYREELILYTSSAPVSFSSDMAHRKLGAKNFELSNHLGNVLVSVTDKKIYVASSGSVVAFDPEIASITDYYPFGSVIQNRSWASQAYRFGFNGKEKETDGTADNYDFGARIYDGRLGRWLAVDPCAHRYPDAGSYQYALNLPTMFTDDGGRTIKPSEITPAYNLSSAPSKAEDFGYTDLDRTKVPVLTFNQATNEYDIVIPLVQQYANSFNPESAQRAIVEKANPGLIEEVEYHENVHVKQYVEAASMDVSVNIDLGKGGTVYSGRPDIVLTNIRKDWVKAIDDDKNKMIDSKKSELDKTEKYAVLKNPGLPADQREKLQAEYNAEVDNYVNTTVKTFGEGKMAEMNQFITKKIWPHIFQQMNNNVVQYTTVDHDIEQEAIDATKAAYPCGYTDGATKPECKQINYEATKEQ